ncbi:putative serine/threonine-protein kinase [Nymphaea thermarum]|nr:putative serine/threonine-protein kinase [Nymphaea thermarum]
MSPHRGIEPLLASQMKSFFVCWFLSFCFFPSSCTAGDSTEYTACAPRSCSGIPIDYPFSLSSAPSTSCGFPELNLTCQGDEANARPFLVTRTGLKFIVKGINYRTQTIKLVIDPSTIMVSKCPHPSTNITLFNITNGGRLPLNFATNYGPVTFFYGCSAKPSASGRLDSDLGVHIPGYNFTSNLVLGCSISEANFYTYAFSNEDNLYEAYNWLSSCKATLSFPVLASSFSGGARDMATSLFINEFDLVWAVDSMGICAASGGRCGYNITSGYFLCFCKQESRNCSPLSVLSPQMAPQHIETVVTSKLYESYGTLKQMDANHNRPSSSYRQFSVSMFTVRHSIPLGFSFEKTSYRKRMLPTPCTRKS